MPAGPTLSYKQIVSQAIWDDGAFGTVRIYRMSKDGSSTVVAGKSIAPNRDMSFQAILNELIMLQQAQCEFVVKYVAQDVGQVGESGNVMIFTELCQCSVEAMLDFNNRSHFAIRAWGDSYRRVSPPKFDGLEEVVVCLDSILQGLIFLHDYTIIHRDIKPLNILRSFDGKYKLCDFGLAKIVQGRKHTTKAYSEWYRAPEVSTGSYSFSSDIFATAVTFMDMLAQYQGDNGAVKYRDMFFSNETRNFTDLFALQEFRRTVPKEARRYLPLIEQMIQMPPSLRPTLEQVRTYLKEQTSVPPFEDLDLDSGSEHEIIHPPSASQLPQNTSTLQARPARVTLSDGRVIDIVSFWHDDSGRLGGTTYTGEHVHI